VSTRHGGVMGCAIAIRLLRSGPHSNRPTRAAQMPIRESRRYMMTLSPLVSRDNRFSFSMALSNCDALRLSPLMDQQQRTGSSFPRCGSLAAGCRSTSTQQAPPLVHQRRAASRDQWARYEQLGIKVWGISKDRPPPARKFIAKYTLPFTGFL